MNMNFDPSGCDAAIELSENDVSSNHIIEDMARYRLKDIFQPRISRLCEENGRSKEQVIYLWWFLRIIHPNVYRKNHLGQKKKRIGLLASYFGVLDGEF